MKLKKVVRKEPSPEKEAPKGRVATPEPIDTSEVSVPEHGKLTELEVYEAKPRETSPTEETQPEDTTKPAEGKEPTKPKTDKTKKKPEKKTPAKKEEAEVAATIAQPQPSDEPTVDLVISDKPEVEESADMTVEPEAEKQPKKGTHHVLSHMATNLTVLRIVTYACSFSYRYMVIDLALSLFAHTYMLLMFHHSLCNSISSVLSYHVLPNLYLCYHHHVYFIYHFTWHAYFNHLLTWGLFDITV